MNRSLLSVLALKTCYVGKRSGTGFIMTLLGRMKLNNGKLIDHGSVTKHETRTKMTFS